MAEPRIYEQDTHRQLGSRSRPEIQQKLVFVDDFTTLPTCPDSPLLTEELKACLKKNNNNFSLLLIINSSGCQISKQSMISFLRQSFVSEMEIFWSKKNSVAKEN